MDASLEFYAVCPAGFERIVSEELKSQGIKRIRPLKGGVAFFGTIEDALKACLWLRSASRVLLVLARIGCASADELYEQTRAIPWQMPRSQSLRTGRIESCATPSFPPCV